MACPLYGNLVVPLRDVKSGILPVAVVRRSSLLKHLMWPFAAHGHHFRPLSSHISWIARLTLFLLDHRLRSEKGRARPVDEEKVGIGLDRYRIDMPMSVEIK
jgi:hypothetical protein